MSNQLSLFEDIDQKLLDERNIVNQQNKEPFACLFCGEISKSRTINNTNHGLIFNGWCIKALLFHNRVFSKDPVERAWLMQHGINPELDRWDLSHSHRANINIYEERFK